MRTVITDVTHKIPFLNGIYPHSMLCIVFQVFAKANTFQDCEAIILFCKADTIFLRLHNRIRKASFLFYEWKLYLIILVWKKHAKRDSVSQSNKHILHYTVWQKRHINKKTLGFRVFSLYTETSYEVGFHPIYWTSSHSDFIR